MFEVSDTTETSREGVAMGVARGSSKTVQPPMLATRRRPEAPERSSAASLRAL